MNDDLISRQAVIELLINSIIQAVELLPIVYPKTGHWFDVGSLSCRCSECGWYENSEYEATPYCPNCGAKMESEEKL